MRFVPLKYAKPGMCIARNLQDSYGSTMLTSKALLTDKNIEKLEELGFPGLYIDDDLSEDIEIEDMISHETRAEGVACVKRQDIDGCKKVAESIVEEILNKGIITLDITDLRSYDDFTFAHSVNVAVYVCIMGMGMELKARTLQKLVLAALLHDIGKLSIPKEILNKDGRLTPEEYILMKSHPQLSYDLIENRVDIPDIIKEAVLSHHENVDGSGYPNGIEGKDQSVYTKMLHVADVYDALTSKRPYKEPYSPYEAIEYLMGACGIMFDKKIVDSLLKYVPLFPKGTMVKLSDGREGIIYDNTEFHNIRPVLKLFDNTLLDLADEQNINIVIEPLESVDNDKIYSLEGERNYMVSTSRRRKILIVDDMVTNLHMLREILEDSYEVILAKSGKQALAYLENNHLPDLIIMDIEMPQMDGLATVRHIQNKYGYQTPILFVTARCDRETVLACRKLNMAGYIIKPYKETFVKSEIKRIFTGRSEVE